MAAITLKLATAPPPKLVAGPAAAVARPQSRLALTASSSGSSPGFECAARSS
jgi:hypothetical protein